MAEPRTRRPQPRRPGTIPATPGVRPGGTGGSRIEWHTLPNSVLGVLKRFGVYRPLGAGAGRPLPVLYLFRGHESEWVGAQDGRQGLVRILDRLIASGQIAPLWVVLPGFMAPDYRSQGVPVNWSADGRDRGVGNGRFEEHFFEVKSYVERTLPVLGDRRHQAVDGFSMGGYAATLLATRHPHLFASAGAYDGSFMWPGQIDPRRRPRGRADGLWFSEACAPFFRRKGKWDRAKMERHNPIALVARARSDRLLTLRSVRFHIRTTASEEHGNFDRTRLLVETFAGLGIRNSFQGSDLALSPHARHTWHWADVHIEGTLVLHDRVFRGMM